MVAGELYHTRIADLAITYNDGLKAEFSDPSNIVSSREEERAVNNQEEGLLAGEAAARAGTWLLTATCYRTVTAARASITVLTATPKAWRRAKLKVMGRELKTWFMAVGNTCGARWQCLTPWQAHRGGGQIKCPLKHHTRVVLA